MSGKWNRYESGNDKATSEWNHAIVYYNDRAFQEQFPAKVTASFSACYKINRMKVFHEFGIKIVNLTGSPENHLYKYDSEAGRVKIDNTKIVLPNISYKIGF